MIANNKIQLTDTAYRITMIVVALVFPGTVSFCFGLSLIWNVPRFTFLLGVLSIIVYLLGICLTISSKRRQETPLHYDGQIIVTAPDDGLKRYVFDLGDEPESIESKERITLKITHGYNAPIEDEG